METSPDIDIKRYLRLLYYKRYLFIAVVVLVTSLVMAAGYILPKKYEAASTVLVERNYLDVILRGISVTTPSIDDRVQAVAMMLRSKPLILRVIRDLDLDLTRSDAELESLVKTFIKKTEVKLGSQSGRGGMDMFTVSFKHNNPVTARDYVNTLVRLYVEESMSSSSQDSYGANKFLAEQLNIFKEKMSAIDSEIAVLSQQKDVGQDRMLEIQKKLDALLQQYTEQHPEVVKLKDEMQALKNRSRGRTHVSIKKRGVFLDKSAESVDASTAPPDSSQQTDRTGIPATVANEKIRGPEAAYSVPIRQRLAELERDRETYKKMYEEMVAAQGKSEISSRMDVQDRKSALKIIEPAVLPTQPVFPNRIIMILCGIVAGLGAGFGLIVLLDNINKSVKTTDSLRGFGLPVLAVIPRLSTEEEERRTRQKNLVLYAAAGVYYVGVLTVLVMEMIK